MEYQVRILEYAFVYTELRCDLVEHSFLTFGTNLSPIAIEEYYLVWGEELLSKDVVRS